ncbi:FecR/PupR family sigma factor regulator, partial [Pseudomonas aeruginosa]|uniref:FecR/PupR family sigma factor regulator n=1 Tax=Pseudomonas aeruginosa TaxID=287 RepID=UPI0024B7FFA9
WLVRLRSQPADDRLQRACAAWRAEHGEHERAWQQVSALNEELQGRFKALPGGVAYGTLDSSAQRLQRRQAHVAGDDEAIGPGHGVHLRPFEAPHAVG